MIKKQRSKEMTGEESNIKTKLESTVQEPIKLRCLRECDMPGLGLFKGGDIIADPEKVARIADNPNFEQIHVEQ